MKRFIVIVLAFILQICLVACTEQQSIVENDVEYTERQSIFERDSYFSIQFIDVGQGDAALIECDGHYMLIDGGDKSHGEKVKAVLDEKDVTHLDILAISHMHNDHIGGLPRALSGISKIDTVISNVDDSNESSFNALINELNYIGTEIDIPKKGAKYKLGKAIIEIVYNSDQNHNDSLVLLITYGNTTFLFTGDIEYKTVSAICDYYEDEFHFPVTLLKVAHHGAKDSTEYRFIRMVQPKYAIISVGKDNNYGHPSEKVLDLLQQTPDFCKYYRTDENGDIIVTSDGEELSITSEK